MLNVIRLANGGTVRIPAEIWEDVQRLSVEMTISLGRPVKESTVIQLLLRRSMTDCKPDALVAMIDD